MKHLFCTYTFFLFSVCCLAQETVERTRKLTPRVTEKYNVLKTDYSVNQGAYAAYLKKTLIAGGRYNQNKKVGTWTFFNNTGQVNQRYDYDRKQVVYEKPSDSTTTIRYVVDDSLKTNFTFLRPIRIGGSYYGYLRYTNLVKLPPNLTNLNNATDRIFMELLVSPGGRLAEFKIHITPVIAMDDQEDIILKLNINLLDEEDKVFVPGKLNDKVVPVRILIPCYFTRSNEITL